MKFRNLFLTLILYIVSISAMAGTHFQTFNPNQYEKINGKYALKGQLLVATRPGMESAGFIQQFKRTLKDNGTNLTNSKVISSNSVKIKVIKFNFESNKSLPAVIKSLENSPNVAWVQPNYIYNIDVDPRESMPNDPKLSDQYHHQLMQNIKAWDISTGSNVLIAVTDDGFDINHEDLASRFIPKGYNFCDNNTDVTPKDYSGEHGTHVSGIAAAELNNAKGGAGVAGNANILPIKFYGSSCDWTSELIYRAYQYSVDTGAKIISTSYNIDSFVGDNTIIAALDYGYDRGVLHFNSAGNNGEKNPPRQAFDELILVASTDKSDLKSDFSNYGNRVQISAPGEDILSTVPDNKYEYMSGTSMATPNAAGSAALIWSAHPSWNRDQVAAQLIGTADNIDDKNAGYEGLLGSGRINNTRALTEQLAPVKVSKVLVTTQTEIGSQKKTVNITVRFDKLLDPKIVNQGDHWEVKSMAGSTIVPAQMGHRWTIGSMQLELNLPKLKPGKYQLTVKDTLRDPFGQALDGNNSGTAGGDFVYMFEVK